MLNFRWNTKKQVNPDINKIIIIDADEDYRVLIGHKLQKLFNKCQIDYYDPMDKGRPDKNFSWYTYDLLVLDYYLEQEGNGLDWFLDIPADDRPVTIMLTGRGDEQIAVQAIKCGVDGYLAKESFNLSELENTIRDAFQWKEQNHIPLEGQQIHTHTLNRESEQYMLKGRFHAAIESLNKNNLTDKHLVIISPNIIRIKEKRPENLAELMNYVYQESQEYFEKKGILCEATPFKDKYVILLLTTKNLSEVLLGFYKHMEEIKANIDMDEFCCELSIGAVSINVNSEDIYGCISIASTLCNQANAKKENKISIYKQMDVSGNNESENKKENKPDYLSFDIANAVREGRILANYQPWVYISNDESISVKDIYDVRIELIDNEGKIIEQNERINLLQNVFATRVIDRWMTRECISQLEELARNNGDGNIKFAIRLTTDSIADPKFLTWCEALLLNSNCPKGSLIFEIDASGFLEHTKPACRLIKKLRDKFNIKFVLSGLLNHGQYVKVAGKAFFDFVKVNMTELMHNSDNNFNQLVSDIKNNGSMTVAINMETADTLSLATEYSIDYIHGYLIEKPKKDILASATSDLSFEI